MAKFDIGDKIWYRGIKCEIVDRLQPNKYALQCGNKEVKGDLESGFVGEYEICIDNDKKPKFWIFK